MSKRKHHIISKPFLASPLAFLTIINVFLNQIYLKLLQVKTKIASL